MKELRRGRRGRNSIVHLGFLNAVTGHKTNKGSVIARLILILQAAKRKGVSYKVDNRKDARTLRPRQHEEVRTFANHIRETNRSAERDARGKMLKKRRVGAAKHGRIA